VNTSVTHHSVSTLRAQKVFKPTAQTSNKFTHSAPPHAAKKSQISAKPKFQPNTPPRKAYTCAHTLTVNTSVTHHSVSKLRAQKVFKPTAQTSNKFTPSAPPHAAKKSQISAKPKFQPNTPPRKACPCAHTFTVNASVTHHSISKLQAQKVFKPTAQTTTKFTPCPTFLLVAAFFATFAP
jgi:hypothetical protein